MEGCTFKQPVPRKLLMEREGASRRVFTFPKRERLRSRRDFQVLLGRGRRFAAHGVAFRYLPNGLAWCRLGLAVSRKLGKAAKRNRIRRLLREAYRLTKHRFPVPVDIIALPRKGEELTFEKARLAFRALAREVAEKVEQPGE